MFDISTVSKSVVVGLIRQAHELSDLKAPAASTLQRLSVAVLSERLQGLLADDSLVITVTDDQPEVRLAADVAKEIAAKVAAEEKKAARKAEGVRAGRKPKFSDDMIITRVTVKNPRREGSGGNARFDCFKTGQTVAEFVAGVVALGYSSSRAHRTLRYAASEGHVNVDEAKKG